MTTFGLSSEPPNLDPALNSGTTARAVTLQRYRDGVLGDVTPAMAEAGREIIERCVAHLIGFLDRAFGKDDGA